MEESQEVHRGNSGVELILSHGHWWQEIVSSSSLEEGMATHSSILAWRILSTKEPDGVQSLGLKKS